MEMTEKDMKIAEVIGSVTDQELEAARARSFMQRIANAFTGSGRVKRPFEFQGLGTEPTATEPPFSYIPTSDEENPTIPGVDAMPDAAAPVRALANW